MNETQQREVQTSVGEQPEPMYQKVYDAFSEEKDYGNPQDQSDLLIAEFRGLLETIVSSGIQDLFEWSLHEDKDVVNARILYDQGHYVEITLMLSARGDYKGYKARLNTVSQKRGRKNRSGRLIVAGRGKQKKRETKAINLDMLNALHMIDISGGQ
ncbi:hypothetical protein KY326_00995 [Candidatus Woesearchaeota archaeon]|nr:hypothetical protein [Candidatus Woesearchaeota archaeon]